MISRYSPFPFLAAVVFALAAFLPAFAAATPEGALQAEQMLSARHWAQAVKIENINEASRYPETVYGTVFEFQDLLWFYTTTGTQPLRASKDRLEEYKENLLPLLRTMEPGFVSFTELAPATTFEDGYPSLANGCVIESIYSFNERKSEGEPILEARLLLYSSEQAHRTSGSRNTTGHAVLIYKTPAGFFYVDPPKIDATGQLTKAREWDPLAIAQEIESHYGKIEIKNAFFKPFDAPGTALAQSN